MPARVSGSTLAVLASIAVLLATEPWVSARGSLQLRLSSRVLSPGSDLLVIVSVDPESANRELTVMVDSPAYLRSSMQPLEGADAAKTHQFWFTALPSGEYTLEARVAGSSGGTREVASSNFVVGAGAAVPKR